jgi:hypothetical protein
MEGIADPPELRGIIPNANKHIFDHIALNTDPMKQFLVRVTYLEIYNEDIRDLLSKDPTTTLELKENVDSGVYVKDLHNVVVRSAADIDTYLQVRAIALELLSDTLARHSAANTTRSSCSSIRYS